MSSIDDLLIQYRNAVALRAEFETKDDVRGYARGGPMLVSSREDEEKARQAIVDKFAQLSGELLSAKDALAAVGRMFK